MAEETRKIKPQIIDDAYSQAYVFELPGYEPIEILFRPITRKQWRAFYERIDKVPANKQGEERAKFVVDRIVSWSLEVAPSMEAFDTLHPEPLATSIIDFFYNGSTTDKVESQLKN